MGVKMKGRITFTLDLDANASGTSFHGVTITVNPLKLLEALGDSPVSDDYKVSKEWGFTKEDKVFRLYDWKETSLYDGSLPSVESFWTSDRVTLHIGHKRENIDDAKALAAELQNICGSEDQVR